MMNGVWSTEADRRVLDPWGPDRLTVQLEKRNGDVMAARVPLPIKALFAPRLCSDGREAHITWKYRPGRGSDSDARWTGVPPAGAAPACDGKKPASNRPTA
jgi:hypothetical protein